MKKCIVLFLFLFMYFHSGYAPVKSEKQRKADIENFLEAERVRELKLFISTAPFSVELLQNALRLYVKHPDVTYCQAVLETGNFTSELFLKHNNLIGMQYATKRETTANKKVIAEKVRNYAGYSHWSDCVKDIGLWQDYWETEGHDLEDYYAFLKRLPFATDKKYVIKLKQIRT